MEPLPRAGANCATRGIIKMVADAGTGEVLGVSMVEASAGEVIREAVMGRRFPATLDACTDRLHVYPTLG